MGWRKDESARWGLATHRWCIATFALGMVVLVGACFDAEDDDPTPERDVRGEAPAEDVVPDVDEPDVEEPAPPPDEPDAPSDEARACLAPCVADRECGEGFACATFQDGAYCAAACMRDDDCGPNERCEIREVGGDLLQVCAPSAGICTTCLDLDDDGFGVGPGCEGPQDCDDADPDVYPGAPEICNGRDMNCDGVVDTGFRNAEGVYDTVEHCGACGNACSAGQSCDAGVCVGLTCLDLDDDGFGVGPGCEGPQDCNDADPDVYPGAPEICNGRDMNCDGLVDNDPVDAGLPCDTGLLGRCAPGLTECRNGTLVCVPLHEPAAEERCDDEDWTCDGFVDRNADGTPLNRACYEGPPGTTGIGECRMGAQACHGGTWGECEGQVLPRPETCSGRDEDCDGIADNNVPGLDTDSANCGSCGNVCTGGTFCLGGLCILD